MADDAIPGVHRVAFGRAPLALTGFIAGALFGGIALTVHVLMAPDVMLDCAAGSWWGAVWDAVVAGGAAGLVGAGVGRWLSRLRCPFCHGELRSGGPSGESEAP